MAGIFAAGKITVKERLVLLERKQMNKVNKHILVAILLVVCCRNVMAQSYYNEWIDFNKTYYKFKVGATGLYRITYNDLQQMQLSAVPAQNFQLWRNGKQVPLFTSAPAGPLTTSGYIEFWGQRNDGVTDRDLYRLPSYQLSDQESLLTDTAAFFLTSNPAANNLRFLSTPNKLTGTLPPAEQYFMYALRKNFKERIHRGWAEIVGERVYSSSYDIGEMWSSFDIDPTIAPTTTSAGSPGTPLTFTFAENLYPAPLGPPAKIKTAIAGSSALSRFYTLELNGQTLISASISSFNARIDSNPNISAAQIPTANATFKITNKSSNQFDHIVSNFVELNYPRQFNFGNQKSFAFTIEPSLLSKYIEITNFNAGSSIPVLYDLTNLRRYEAVVSSGVVKFLIQPSAEAVQFVLVSQETTSVLSIGQPEKRTFVNYNLSANQGDYLIITHPILQQPYSGADQVEAYRAYRSSASGGSYNTRVYDINQLVDQFGYGIKKNPLSIKNFLRYARTNFSVAPKYTFLIGRGLSYADYRQNETDANADRLNLIPTWGYPASDILLASNTMDPIMNTLISRISVVRPQELADYLVKVKEYESAQQNNVQTLDNKAWMKNIVHVVGASDAGLDGLLTSYMRKYETTIEDTLFGGIVTNFNKTVTGPVTPITGSLMKQMFEKGISLLSYFGHSSASSLDYNLNDPSEYNNTGKYPVFSVSGCNAGDLYSFDTARFSVTSTLSEIFVLAKSRGAIGFIASTHFGVTNYLDYYNDALYRSINKTGYGKSLTYNMSEAINVLLGGSGSNNRLARLHAEETTLNGDPAIKMNSFPKPDFVVEELQIKISPNIVSVADTKFNVKAYFHNIGMAKGDSLRIQVRRRYPNGTDTLLVNKKIRSVRFSDSLNIDVPIIASRDKGENKIVVSVDTDGAYDELSETNNSATTTFVILEDELKPVYPYNFAIINRANAKPVASTAEASGIMRQYVFEIDTTELFNSTAKVVKNVASSGGIIEFDPGFTYRDSTVYHWRVAPVPTNGQYVWNYASFTYISGTNLGFSQANQYQHQKSATSNLALDPSDNTWKFGKRVESMFITNSIFGTSGGEDADFRISLSDHPYINSGCVGHSVLFNVFDPKTLLPYYNQRTPSIVPAGNYGSFMSSYPSCDKPGREYNFEYSYMDTSGRRKMRDFLDWVPAGAYVTARILIDQPFNEVPLVSTWKNDQQVYGTGNTLYDRFKSAGFASIDSFNKLKTWVFIYKKPDPTGLNNIEFQPAAKLSEGLYDKITLVVPIPAYDTLGHIVSPQFGPAKNWKQLTWRGTSAETNSADIAVVNVVGISATGRADTLYRLNTTQQTFDLSAVSASQYPYLQLDMRNQDGKNYTPYQLKSWRLYYTPVPEGALAANLNYHFKDTLELGEKLDFSIAFKNVSDVVFADSLVANLTVYDKNNAATVVPVLKRKTLQPGDTTLISASIDTKTLEGTNTVFLDVNPNYLQPEQYRFNNFLYKNFFVKADTYNPLMDVTFDGVHILNGDIVSAKPRIVIKIKDEAKFLALDDTSLATLFVRYPGTSNALYRVAFGADTLKFLPADITSGKNEATIEYAPRFLPDSNGDFYELVVKAKDKSGNPAGNTEYRVRFQVFNKPMISNMFNYPNPFTTSTAFVFTLTGTEVPQNIRIQILTVTGKIVKEITKLELGALHLGRNITDYKWDGTDQYGSKLANGIYLYRVLTNLNGASLDKFKTTDSFGDNIDTDKYFNKGYGKMYLMR